MIYNTTHLAMPAQPKSYSAPKYPPSGMNVCLSPIMPEKSSCRAPVSPIKSALSSFDDYMVPAIQDLQLPVPGPTFTHSIPRSSAPVCSPSRNSMLTQRSSADSDDGTVAKLIGVIMILAVLFKALTG